MQKLINLKIIGLASISNLILGIIVGSLVKVTVTNKVMGIHLVDTAGSKTIDQILLAWIFFTAVFGLNELLVALTMICLKKSRITQNPYLLVFISSAIVGLLSGLLLAFADPMGITVESDSQFLRLCSKS